MAIDLRLRRFQRKRVGIHMTPVCVLQMSGAIDKKCREIWVHPPIVVPEQIELQAICERYPPPLNVCPRKPLAAQLRQYRSNRVPRETVAKQKCRERQPLVSAQRRAPLALLNQLGHCSLEYLDFG